MVDDGTSNVTSLGHVQERWGGEGRPLSPRTAATRPPPPVVLLLCAPRRSGKRTPLTGAQTGIHGCEDGEKSPSLVTSLPEATLHFKGF